MLNVEDEGIYYTAYVCCSTCLPATFSILRCWQHCSILPSKGSFAKEADTEQLGYENWHLELTFVVSAVP
jgi:hypothetical protein